MITFEPKLTRAAARAIGTCCIVLAAGTQAVWAAPNVKATTVAVDRFSYLEDSSDAQARAWIRLQNERTLAELEGDPRFKEYYEYALDSERALSSVDFRGLLAPTGRMWLRDDWVYQVWVEADHPRGLWRRTSLRAFLKREPEWEVLLDIDMLGASEQKRWILIQTLFSPNGRRCLLQLSLDGSITTAWREYDLDRRSFVDGGFRVPASARSSQVVWRTDDSVLVAADFGPGSLNASGNPIMVKEWSRGKALSTATVVLQGKLDDVEVAISTLDTSQKGGVRTIHIKHSDRDNRSNWWRLDKEGHLDRLMAPLTRTLPFVYRDQYIILLQGDWRIGNKTWKKGTLIAVPASEITRPSPRVSIVLEPMKDASFTMGMAATRGGLLLFGSELGYGRIWRCRLEHEKWVTDVVSLPDHGVVIEGAADPGSDVAFFRYESFLHPPALYRVDVARNRVEHVASTPALFRTADFVVEQRTATSADGAEVPYSLVRPRVLRFDGRAPTIIAAYGAIGFVNFPLYSATLGKLWLEQGGVYVLANVRGGQERGPAWAVKRADRKHTYADTIAVTEDLIRANVTAAKRVGFVGHSAGGLLGGVLLTQRPDLFGAMVLKGALLDQFRMDLIVSGPAAWVQEFGSPEVPHELAFLKKTSPFQNLKAQAGACRPLIITSSADQNVQPGQPRRFAAKMESLGMPFLFYETEDGGHFFAATPLQRARLDAVIFVYLARQLRDAQSPSREPR